MLKGAENFNNSFERRVMSGKRLPGAPYDGAKAFTLIELIVAVALLVLAITFSSMIFKVSLGTRRTAAANDEIMQKVRAITDQLSRDFTGLCKDAPLLIQFEQLNPTSPQFRFDQIMFFATGDFQSIQRYDGTPKTPTFSGAPIRGNAARIYYGHADVFDSSGWRLYNDSNSLSRRQHILTADTTIYDWPDPNLSRFADFVFSPPLSDNECFEHDRMSLAQWKIVNQAQYDPSTGVVIPVCFDSRTQIDLTNPQGLTLHNLMCEDIESFAIQWAYWDGTTNSLLWYPDNTSLFHFDLINPGTVRFGVRFNIPSDNASGTAWFAIESGLVQYNNTGNPSLDNFPGNFYPDAIRFTFTLRDSRGVIETGRTFSHIVYIGD